MFLKNKIIFILQIFLINEESWSQKGSTFVVYIPNCL